MRQLECISTPSKLLVLEEKNKPLPVTSSFEPEYAEEERRLYREVLLVLNELAVP